MTWPELHHTSVPDLLTKLIGKSLAVMQAPNFSPGFAWRGEPAIYDGITARIDRDGFLRGGNYNEWLEEEIAWYEGWWLQVLPVMRPHDLRSPMRAGQRVPEMDWLNYAQHHGCRTRLVDWTQSPLVALYFACSTEFDRPARVWGFDTSVLESKMGAKWDGVGVQRLPTGDRDIADAAWRSDAKPWIVTQYNRVPPERMKAQQGLFTLAGRLGERHDSLLDALLPDGAKLVVRVPASMKTGLLGALRWFNVHHDSLQFPMIDEVARIIERRRK